LHVLVLGDHDLIDAAVEAAKLDLHSWQAARPTAAAKLSSVGRLAAKLSSVGGDLSEGTMHGPTIL
jgi:hypothetical protein